MRAVDRASIGVQRAELTAALEIVARRLGADRETAIAAVAWSRFPRR